MPFRKRLSLRIWDLLENDRLSIAVGLFLHRFNPQKPPPASSLLLLAIRSREDHSEGEEGRETDFLANFPSDLSFQSSAVNSASTEIEVPETVIHNSKNTTHISPSLVSCEGKTPESITDLKRVIELKSEGQEPLRVHIVADRQGLWKDQH
ncbi:hypothetical protein PROFUN_03029 [Planoprotostelium fungivorum]|uniref:Uncharacterized protein n=1 Tax=Planoprotostelium fungivorum TaxID=1890364 RepID=A0A2P6NXI6_9EUKA|nr:hypothetical protein PROFUN_03029 [Planoprotostelium fungivorum]